MKRKKYPFTAIVGQEDMKLALVLNAVLPVIGGVLIKGEKGTAKSTAVRALADILPPFGSDGSEAMQVVELPVNATEDRVVGTIDLEHALKEGEKKFEPGLLAKAHNNILYVDEINLLDDHVVDVLLDAAAMGVVLVTLLAVPLSAGFFVVRPYEEAAWAVFYRDITAAEAETE